MSRFEREKISKKVHTTSRWFAALAGIGILIIGLQLFYRGTGFDLFDINYSISRLFSDSPAAETKKSSVNNPVFERNVTAPSTSLQAPNSTEDVAEFLKNHILLTPIKSVQNSIAVNNHEQAVDKYISVPLLSLVNPSELYNPEMAVVYAQNLKQGGILPKVKDVKISKWSVGISLTPGISFTHLKYTRLDEINTRSSGNTQYGFYQSQTERNKLNKALMKYSIGLDLNYRVNDFLSFQTGLVYMNAGESVQVKEIIAESSGKTQTANLPTDTRYFSGIPDFESPKESGNNDNVRFANNVSYLEIPMVVNYKVKTLNPLTSIEVQAGVSVTKLNSVNAVVYNFENDGYYVINGSEPNIYRTYGSNAIAGINLNKYITNTIQIFANPQIKAGLTNIFDQGYNIKQHYYSAGVRLGMKINL